MASAAGGELLATGGRDDLVLLWDIGRPPVPALPGFTRVQSPSAGAAETDQKSA